MIEEQTLPTPQQAAYIQKQLAHHHQQHLLMKRICHIALGLFTAFFLVLAFTSLAQGEWVLSLLLCAFCGLFYGIYRFLQQFWYGPEVFVYVEMSLLELRGEYIKKHIGTGRQGRIAHLVDKDEFSFERRLMRRSKIKPGQQVALLVYPRAKFIERNWTFGFPLAIAINDVTGWEVIE